MPYITVESGTLSDEQKEELIRRLTEVSSEIMKVPQEFFVLQLRKYQIKISVSVEKRLTKLKKNIRRNISNFQFINELN